MKFLLKVEDAFQIKGRGLILLPSLSEDENLPSLTEVLLIIPNGEKIVTEAIFGVEFFSYENPKDYKLPQTFCILKNLEKEKVLIGTEVWLK